MSNAEKIIDYVQKNCHGNMFLVFDDNEGNCLLSVKGIVPEIAELLYDITLLKRRDETTGEIVRIEAYNIMMKAMVNLVASHPDIEREFMANCEKLKRICGRSNERGN